MFGKKKEKPQVEAIEVLKKEDISVYAINARDMELPFILIKTNEDLEKSSNKAAEASLTTISGKGEIGHEQKERSHWSALFNPAGMSGYKLEDLKKPSIEAVTQVSGDQIPRDITFNRIDPGQQFPATSTTSIQSTTTGTFNIISGAVIIGKKVDTQESE